MVNITILFDNLTKVTSLTDKTAVQFWMKNWEKVFVSLLEKVIYHNFTTIMWTQ